MLFRFGVVLPARMTEGGGSLLVAGSRPELGGWDPQRALPMQPARPTAPLPAQEPALWLAEVALPDEDAASPFWYKFLRRQGGELLWEGNGRAVRPVGGERSGAGGPGAARPSGGPGGTERRRELRSLGARRRLRPPARSPAASAGRAVPLPPGPSRSWALPAAASRPGKARTALAGRASSAVVT